MDHLNTIISIFVQKSNKKSDSVIFDRSIKKNNKIIEDEINFDEEIDFDNPNEPAPVE